MAAEPGVLYLVTGAPGAGKTTLVGQLAGAFDRLAILDSDLFAESAHPEWEAWANGWLLVAHGLARSGLGAVLCGYGLNRSAVA
ncbi:MAG TPA: hypothetical protein VM030_01810, partial [Acidimicrobiales bacterium]|nr:hypothetical protein [Acidimicrobiales bacterium]